MSEMRKNKKGDKPKKKKHRLRISADRTLGVIISVAVALASILIYNWTVEQLYVEPFASVSQIYSRKVDRSNCSDEIIAERKMFGDCVPRLCGRGVDDNIIFPEEVQQLLAIAQKGLALGGGSGGASILDLQSGALSKGDKFINIHHELKNRGEVLLTPEDLDLYHDVTQKVKKVIADEFEVLESKLLLGSPTFFSQMTNRSAVTAHDEYWHSHVDKITYGFFHYTSLIYLKNYEADFTGGRFIFDDKNEKKEVVEPKAGRVSFFTSGSENTHHVEKILSGTRYALTIAFTCDPTKGSSKLVVPT